MPEMPPCAGGTIIQWAHMSDENLVLVIDWAGWIVSNVLVGAFFPLMAMGIMHGLKLILRGQFPIDYFAPFRDGQLGFVGVGWVVAALVELLKFSVKHSGISVLGYGLSLAAFAALSALVAAAGSVSPVQVPTTRPATKMQWILTYPAFTAASVLCVLTLLLCAIVHGKTS